jgi:hypothetical protein
MMMTTMMMMMIMMMIMMVITMTMIVCVCVCVDHHQPINVSTAGAQAFLMDYTRRTGHNPPCGPSAGWWVLTTANAAWTNGLMCLLKLAGARDNKFLVTHPMTDERCLTSAIAH